MLYWSLMYPLPLPPPRQFDFYAVNLCCIPDPAVCLLRFCSVFGRVGIRVVITLVDAKHFLLEGITFSCVVIHKPQSFSFGFLRSWLSYLSLVRGYRSLHDRGNAQYFNRYLAERSVHQVICTSDINPLT